MCCNSTWFSDSFVKKHDTYDSSSSDDDLLIKQILKHRFDKLSACYSISQSISLPFSRLPFSEEQSLFFCGLEILVMKSIG